MITWIDIFSNFDTDIFPFSSMQTIFTLKNTSKRFKPIVNSWIKYQISLIFNQFDVSVLCRCDVCAIYKRQCFENTYAYIYPQCRYSLMSIQSNNR